LNQEYNLKIIKEEEKKVLQDCDHILYMYSTSLSSRAANSALFISLFKKGKGTIAIKLI
jgi:hypothetical protein